MWTKTGKLSKQFALCMKKIPLVFLHECRSLLYGSWDYQEFRRLHLKEYMMMCQGFGADFTSKDMYGSDIIAPVCALAAFKIGVLLNTLLWHKTHAHMLPTCMCVTIRQAKCQSISQPAGLAWRSASRAFEVVCLWQVQFGWV